MIRNDGRIAHQLRYVLRNKATGDVYLVVTFSLFLEESVNADGTIKGANGANRVTNGHTNGHSNGTTQKNGSLNGYHHNGSTNSHEEDID